MVTAVIKLPFVYWDSIEQPKSWTYARVIAFSSQAATVSPEAIAIGDPITGVVVNTSSKYKTAQLIGWKLVPQPAPETNIMFSAPHSYPHPPLF